MPNFSFTYRAIKGEFASAFREISRPMAKAATLALLDVTVIAKANARAAIASAGFSSKWQNAMRSNVYPNPDKKVYSLNAAATVYHRIPYAGVFENGATIPGSPFLWIPFPSVQARYRGRRMSPALFTQEVGPLHFFMSKQGLPTLAAYLPLGSDLAKLTIARFRAGERRRKARGILSVISVPVFFGINQVLMKQKFKIIPIIKKAKEQLGELYLERIKQRK